MPVKTDTIVDDATKEMLAAVAPQVGVPRVLAAAPEIMVALDLELPAGMDI